MFESLFGELSKLGSWRWPVAEGKVTAVDLERINDGESWRLSIAYQFSVGEDGPYTGEGFWSPMFSYNSAKKLRAARRRMRVGSSVQVRYRADDPSVNAMDSSVRKLLDRR